MGNAAIAAQNFADAGLLTTISSQVSAMPASNVFVEHVFRRWRSTSNSAFIVVDLRSLLSIDTAGLFGMTMTSNGTARLRLSTTDPTGATGDAFDSSTMSVDTTYNSFVYALSSPVSARYVRVDLTDPSTTYVELGRLFVGLRNTFDTNFSYGWQRSWQDRSVRSKTRGGQTQIWLDNMYRELDVTFNFLTADERNGFVEAIDRMNGLHSDVLFITDETSSNRARDSIWGLMTEATPVVQSYFDRFTKQYKIEERL